MAEFLVCYLMQSNLSEGLVSVHSLSNTSLLNVLTLPILATNNALLPLLKLFKTVGVCNVLDFIEETHFVTSYDVPKLFL